jgi:DNA topoisomerase-3
MVIELIRGAGIELLTSPEMTGQWERRLNEISRGAASDGQFMENVKKFAAMIVGKVRVQARAAKNSFESEAPAAKKGAAARGKGADRQGRSSSSGGTGSTALKAAAEPSEKAPAGNAAVPQPQAASPAAPAIVAACPRPGCGGSIFMGRKGYGCSHYKEGCKFVIWKESFGRMLTDAQIIALIDKGRTAKLKLIQPDGSTVEGRLILKDVNSGALDVERMN